MGSKQDHDQKRSSLIALLLLIGAGAVLFIGMSQEQKQSAGQGHRRSEAHDNLVNRHLFLTNEKIEATRQQAEIKANEQIYGLRKNVQAPPKVEARGVDLEADYRAYEVAEQIGRGPQPTPGAQSPNEWVQEELFYDEQQREYSEAYKAEYARQFVENARRKGWDVRLSDDYRVLSVKPLRKPTNQGTVFSTGVGGAN